MKLVNPRSASAAVQQSADELLLVLLRDLEEYGKRNGRPDWPVMDVAGFRLHGIPYRPGVWFDGCSSAKRMLLSRAIRYLEDTRRVERIISGSRDRVRFVVFTPRGFKQALDAAGITVNRDIINHGLELTEWGEFLIDSLDSSYDDFDGQLSPIDWMTSSDAPSDESTDSSAN